jgi:EmrB/QacA subfamily drug resistance transporter
VTIALPRIAVSFHAGAGALQWTVNGYTLSLASLILLGGSLGDRFGRRKIFVTGVIWFAAASLLCGLAPSMDALIAARVLQGAGGALLTPGALAILEASFHPDDRAKAIGAWSGLAGIGGALGPFLGGWLVQAGSWRLVFLINVPLAAVVAVVALRHVPESRDPQAPRRLDIPGVLTGAAGLAGLTYGFTAWPARGPTSPAVIGALAVGISGIAAFVIAERRSPHPMLPLEVFASRTFTAANLVTFAVYAALGGVFFLVVLNLQVVARFTPLAAGAALLPITALMLLLSARTGALAQRIGPRLPMTLGPLICAGALVLFSRIGANASYIRNVLPATVALGLGLSLTVAPLTATALGSVSERHAGVASGINNAVARAAGLLAVAVLPLAAGLGTGSLTSPADLAPVYHTAMLLCAGLLTVGAGIALAAIPAKLTGPVTAGQAAPRNPPAAPTRYNCPLTGPPIQPRIYPITTPSPPQPVAESADQQSTATRAAARANKTVGSVERNPAGDAHARICCAEVHHCYISGRSACRAP